jgi:hypothetical protein
MGRPTKFKEDMIPMVEKLAGFGITEREIADFFDISQETLMTYKKKHDAFLDAIKKGKLKAEISMTRSLFQSGTNGNVTAQIFFLCNRVPGKWKHVSKILITSSEEGIADVGKKEIEEMHEKLTSTYN